jgi:hypothetical protein
MRPWIIAVLLISGGIPAWADEVALDASNSSLADSLGSGGSDVATACEECCCEKGKLLGFIAPTSLCHADFISPMTNPVYFEDPRTLTEVRTIFAQHAVPNRAPLTGGNVQLLAAQVRVALTDRLSIIATKDGFFWFSDNLPFAPNDGWADVNIGLKYNLYTSDDYSQMLTAGVTYEAPWGSTRAYQGNGGGQFNMFATGGTRVGELGHFVSAMGLKLPADSFKNSQLFYWSAHIDRQIPNTGFYTFAEMNWYHYMASGKRIPGLNIEGGDLFNFGSGNVAGNDIVTGALGLKYKPTQLQEIGCALEAPVTNRRDVLESRLTLDWIVRY